MYLATSQGAIGLYFFGRICSDFCKELKNYTLQLSNLGVGIEDYTADFPS